MTVNIKTVFDPQTTITVSDAEYWDLLNQDLVYSVEGGEPIDRPDFTDPQYAEFATKGSDFSKAIALLLGDTTSEPVVALVSRFIAKTTIGQMNGVAGLDAGAKVPAGQLPDSVKTRSSFRPAGEQDLVVPALAYGSLATATLADATLAAAKTAAAQLGAVVQLPATAVGDAIPFISGLDLLVGQHEAVVIQGIGGGTSRFYGVPGFPLRFRGSTVLKYSGNNYTLTSDAITWAAAGSGFRRLLIDGNGKTGPSLVDHTAFESIADEIRILNFDGIGLDVRRGNNAWWGHVIVSDCGRPGVYSESNPGVSGYDTVVTTALAQVRIWSDTSLTDTTTATNTFSIEDLSLEMARGDRSLEVGNRTGVSWVQTMRFGKLHIENTFGNVAVSTASRGVEAAYELFNVDGAVHDMVFIYAGGPKVPAIRHSQVSNPQYFPGGDVQFLGGWILGSDPALGGATPTLINGKTGSMSFTSVTFARYTGAAVRLEGTYSDFFVDAKTALSETRSGVGRLDFRTTPTRYITPGDAQFNNHLISRGSSPTAFNDQYGTAALIKTNGVHGSTDRRGWFGFGNIAATPANGRLCGVAFNKAYESPPVVHITGWMDGAIVPPKLPALYVKSSTTGFTIYTADAIASAVTNYVVQYTVEG